MINPTWPFSAGEEGGFPHGPLLLPNERQAKLAASFDLAGIKMVLLMKVERSGLPFCLMYSWERYAVLWSLRLGQFMVGPGGLLNHMVNKECLPL